MIFVSLLIDSPDPIELIVVGSHPDDVENDLEAININDFFRLSGQIISASGELDRKPKMNASSFKITKNLGIITGTLLVFPSLKLLIQYTITDTTFSNSRTTLDQNIC